ncbi:MAG TPA: GTP 3',8-cyclase MoaA [Chthonomonadaceae bacterium]|nr:GTP 3',8-cyclase MoaA [Chthonomonadaceae bacterium]
MPLIDSFNRTIDYLRVSVTDRCNFRCVYCMPEAGAPVAPKEQILTYEEIERLLRIAVSLGMTKIRLTGGEPLVRKDIGVLVEKVGALPGLRDLSMTTNGFLLARYAADFARYGLRRINISLDTLRPERFARIARRGSLEDVLAGMDAALSVGLSPIKLNCVVMRGWNEDEVVDFARLTLEQPFNVRFIELMPINWSRGDDSPSEQAGMKAFFALAATPGYRGDTNIRLYARSDLDSFRSTFHLAGEEEGPQGQLDAGQMRRAFVSTAEIRARIEAALGPLEPADVLTNGPARSFRLAGARGTVGFISQITNDMCVHCNRLRLTADGQLRPCLMADGEVDLRTPLRSGASNEEIADLFRLTVLHKPKEHRLEDGLAPVGRNMSQLGG